MPQPLSNNAESELHWREIGLYKHRIGQVVKSLRSGLTPGILVFLTGQAKEKAYWIAEVLGSSVQYVSVGKFLSDQLLEVPRSRRSQKAIQLLAEKVAIAPSCLLDIEILFDPGIALEVLTALRILSKGRELYIDWPGSWQKDENQLFFAVPDDPAYRVYSVTSDIGVADLSGDTYPSLEF